MLDFVGSDVDFQTVDRPWESEPRYRLWRDKRTGLLCLIYRECPADRGDFGLFGYVELPVDFDAASALPDFTVHGGITWHGRLDVDLEGKSERTWIGFDCKHGGDLFQEFQIGDPEWAGVEYRSFAYVVSETENLAAQVAALSDG